MGWAAHAMYFRVRSGAEGYTSHRLGCSFVMDSDAHVFCMDAVGGRFETHHCALQSSAVSDSAECTIFAEVFALCGKSHMQRQGYTPLTLPSMMKLHIALYRQEPLPCTVHPHILQRGEKTICRERLLVYYDSIPNARYCRCQLPDCGVQ